VHGLIPFPDSDEQTSTHKTSYTSTASKYTVAESMCDNITHTGHIMPKCVLYYSTYLGIMWNFVNTQGDSI